MAVALASSCSSDSTPSLLAWEFPYTTGASLKKKKKKKKELQKEVRETDLLNEK